MGSYVPWNKLINDSILLHNGWIQLKWTTSLRETLEQSEHRPDQPPLRATAKWQLIE